MEKNIPEDDDYIEINTADDIDKMFKEFEEEYKAKHPIQYKIQDWLDKCFPSGIADYRAYYALVHPWKIFRHWRYEVEHAWQRAFRGWDDTASWSVGYYLAKILPPIIQQLKERGNGFPISMYDEGYDFTLPQKKLGSIDENGNYIETEADKKALQKWNKILDDIAEGFESYLKYDECYDGKLPLEENEDYKKFQHALDLLKKYYEDLWD